MDVNNMISNTAIESVESRLDFNEISLESLGMHLIFGEIETESMREAITFLLKANQLFDSQEVTFYVNSMGGTTNDGFALIDIMDISRLPVRTVATGNICSMGLLIAAAGHKGLRVMTRNTQVMAHQFSWEIGGKYHELQAVNKAQEHLVHQFTQHFKRHSTMTEKQIKDIMFGKSDMWLTPQECKKLGLVDVIIDALPDITLPGQVLPHEEKSKRRARSQS